MKGRFIRPFFIPLILIITHSDDVFVIDSDGVIRYNRAQCIR